MGGREPVRSRMLLYGPHVPGGRRTGLIHHGEIQDLDVLAKHIARRTGEDELG